MEGHSAAAYEGIRCGSWQSIQGPAGVSLNVASGFRGSQEGVLFFAGRRKRDREGRRVCCRGGLLERDTVLHQQYHLRVHMAKLAVYLAARKANH
jgi:hypothetical protein